MLEPMDEKDLKGRQPCCFPINENPLSALGARQDCQGVMSASPGSRKPVLGTQVGPGEGRAEGWLWRHLPAEISEE